MKKSVVAIAVASLCTFISAVQAEETQSQADNSQEVMVVTANRFEQNKADLLSSSTVISSQDIQQHQDVSLLDTLRRVVGVEYGQNGGRGHQASLYMRGTNSDHLLVLVDGMRVNTAAGGVNLNRFPIDLVQRVEIIRGPNAVVYGSDAIGGVVNIITRSHRGDESKQLTITTGSRNKSSSSAVIRSDHKENGHIQLAAGFEKTDGFDIKEDSSDIDYGYQGQNIAAGYEHQFNENWIGYLSAMGFDNNVEYDSYGTLYHGYVENRSLQGQLNYQAEQWESLLGLNYQRTKNLDYTQAEGIDNASTKKDITLAQLQWANLYHLSDWVLGAGVDVRTESLGDDAMNYGFAHSLAGESRTSKGAFISAEYQKESWKLSSGARYDKHDKYDSYSTWSLAAGYQLDDNHSLRASYGTAFKAPDYTDLTTTPDLKEEKSYNFELGATGQYDNGIMWNLSLYDNTVDNLIIWYVNSGVWSSENVDARIRGAEFDVNFATGPVQHTITAELKDHEDDLGVQLARRAKENYKWMSSLSVGDLDLDLTYNFIGKRLDLPTEAPTADDYIAATQVWDLAGTYWIDDSLSVSGKVANLFDEDYETAIGYLADGRNYSLSLAYQF